MAFLDENEEDPKLMCRLCKMVTYPSDRRWAKLHYMNEDWDD